MLKKLFLLILLIIGSTAIAGEHGLGRITSDGVDLHTFDHSFAGKMNNSVVWGNVDEGKFISTLTMKKYGQVIKSEFTKKDSGVSGKISYTYRNQKVNKTIEFVKLDRNQSIYTIKIDGILLDVTVKADDFINNHFINPEYSSVVEGKEVNFKFNGKACYRYSLGLIMLLFGANSIE